MEIAQETNGRPDSPSVSVVIPTLNEADELPETLRRVRRVREVSEVIVVDGGSTDATVRIAEAAGCHLLRTRASRGLQMQIGARTATADIVILLHADTWLPLEAGRAIFQCFADRRVVGGGFWKRFRVWHPLMIGSRLRCALRLYLFGRVLGDQAIFARREALEAIGGVPDMPLMEEFELCRRLRAIGRLALAPATVTTSTRRFIAHGVVRTYLRMGRVMLQYYLGTPPEQLRRLYEKGREERSRTR